MRLYGKNPVTERIKTNPQSIRKLYLQKKIDLSRVVQEAKKAGLKFESVETTWFKRELGDAHAQGVVAEVEEFRYAPFSVILAGCLDGTSAPVFLDGVTDPQNLGSIIRSLACLGGFSLVLPEHRSACCNETVLRVANGGENHIKIAKVTNIATTVKKVKDKGVWVAGAVQDGTPFEDIPRSVIPAKAGIHKKINSHFCENNKQCSFKECSMAIVIGSEGKGIRPGIRKFLDAGLSLPMSGAPLSYNVAIATTLFCYEINRRRFYEE